MVVITNHGDGELFFTLLLKNREWASDSCGSKWTQLVLSGILEKKRAQPSWEALDTTWVAFEEYKECFKSF